MFFLVFLLNIFYRKIDIFTLFFKKRKKTKAFSDGVTRHKKRENEKKKIMKSINTFMISEKKLLNYFKKSKLRKGLVNYKKHFYTHSIIWKNKSSASGLLLPPSPLDTFYWLGANSMGPKEVMKVIILDFHEKKLYRKTKYRRLENLMRLLIYCIGSKKKKNISYIDMIHLLPIRSVLKSYCIIFVIIRDTA